MADRHGLTPVEGWRWCCVVETITVWSQESGCARCRSVAERGYHERLYRSAVEPLQPPGRPAWEHRWVNRYDYEQAAVADALLADGWEPFAAEHETSGVSRLHLRRRTNGA